MGQKEKKGDTQREREGERVLEGDNEEDTGPNTSTLPFRQSVNSNLNIHPPSPGANTPSSFDIYFTLYTIDVISFSESRLRGFLTGCSDANGLGISDEREQ